MADIKVIGPDGAENFFPEGTPDDVIQKAMADIYPAMRPGSGGAVYAGSGQRATVGQERTLGAMGGIDPLLPVGSGRNPYWQAPGMAPPTTGVYVNPLGETVQHDAEPISKTLTAAANRYGPTLGRVFGQGVGEPIVRAMTGGLDPQSNTLDAGESGFASGMLLGGKNELTAVPAGVASMMRGQSFSEGFDPFLAASDRRDSVLRGNHPYAYYGGGAVGTGLGAAAIPEVRGTGALAKGANIALDTGQAVLGGALSSDPGQRVQGAVTAGALTLPLSRLMRGRVFGSDAPASVPPMTPLVAALPEGPRNAAANRLRKLVPKTGVSPSSPDFMAAEALGPQGVQELKALARREGDTAAAVDARLRQRAQGRPDRLLNAFQDVAGIAPEDAAGQLESMVARGRRAAKPLYDEAFSNPSPMSSPTLDRLLARDASRRGMNQARKIMSNEDVNPYTQGLTFTDNLDEWASQVGGLFPDAGQVSPSSAGRAVSRGDSLAAFLSKQGGLADPGGELVGRNADLWHRNLPFRRRLINPDGLDLGDAAQRALDAGYFPERGRDGTLTGSELLAALEDELRGKPRYSRELTGSQMDTLSAREAEARWGPQGQDVGGDMPQYGARPEPVGGPVYEQQPTTQGVDYVIRGLDTEIAGLPRQPNGQIVMTDYARSLIDTRKQLRTELNRLAEDGNRNPAYVQAVRESGDYLSAKEAFVRSQKDLFNHRVSATDFARMHGAMSPGEKLYAKAGAANAVYNLAQRGALKPGSWPPIVNQKLRVVLGNDAVNALDRVIADEAMMTGTERVVPPANGAPTAGLLETFKDQDANFLADLARNAGVGFVSGGPIGAKAGAAATLAQAAGKLLPYGMNVPTRNALGQVLMGSPEDVQALLNVPRKRYIGAAFEKAGKNPVIRKGVPRIAGQIGAQR